MSQPRDRSEKQQRSWQRPGALQLPPQQSSATSPMCSRSSGYRAAHPSSHRRIGKPEWRGQTRMPIPTFAASCSPTASTSGAGHCASAQVHGSTSQILGPRLLSPSTAPALHVYMGVTAYGATGLIAVTGSSKKNTTYVNTKLKSPAPYRGMCAR